MIVGLRTIWGSKVFFAGWNNSADYRCNYSTGLICCSNCLYLWLSIHHSSALWDHLITWMHNRHR